MLQSLRLRLIVWYVGSLALVLGTFGWGLYATVRRDLGEAIDDMLTAQAGVLEDRLSTSWEKQGGSPAGSLEGALSPDDRTALQRFIARWPRDAGVLEGARPLRVFDRDGALIAASKSVAELNLPALPRVPEEVREGSPVFENVRSPGFRTRLLTAPVVWGGELVCVIQAATPLRLADTSLTKLAFWLVWLLPAILLLIGVIGWVLVTKTLGPVKTIIGRARRIGVEDLHERVEDPRTRDEIGELAQAFNEMLERLETAFKRLRQFSGAASHELRTPLTIIQTEMELALSKPRSTEEYRRALQTSMEAVSEMAAILEALLSLAHKGVASRAVDRSPVELSALLREVGEGHAAQARAKRVAITLNTDGPVWISGERRLLERLLANLVDNAVRHTPPEGMMTLQCGREAQSAYLRVHNTGAGIPEEDIPTLFDRFFSHPQETQSVSTGLGLGLCRWIAEVHQGRIDVASQPGQGAAFTVRLPGA